MYPNYSTTFLLDESRLLFSDVPPNESFISKGLSVPSHDQTIGMYLLVKCPFSATLRHT